ncbi:MAG: adenylate kinase [Alphaproteobacteria bacterium]|jgi:adenylate kinase
MILVLFGPPASGKGTQAARIKVRHGIAHLSTGDMLRAAIAEGTEIGKKAKAIMDEGKLVPDDVVIGIIADRITQADCTKGFVLDGFPRTLNQASALDAMLKAKSLSVTHVIVMDVDEAELIKRVENRAAEARRKGEPVRADDDPETFKKRLGVYKAETAPILPYYEKQGKVRHVDGMKPLDEVTAQIDAVLTGPAPRKSWFR